MDIFRKIFGLDRDDRPYHRYPREDERNHFFNDSDERNHFFNDERNDTFTRRKFDIFTDPLQMHQYFEQQMNEVLKSFGFQEFGHFSSDFSSNFPALDSPLETDVQPSKDIRDQFLKPGYEKPKTNQSEMVDKDLDDKVKSGNFDSLVNEDKESSITPYRPPKSKNYFYGFSHGSQQSFKTITNPDGTIETHRTVRDTEGNEETSVCHKMGNKEYCIIKKRDKQGKEETTEQYVNMTEDEKDIFLRPKKDNPRITNQDPNTDIPWDKYFK